MIWLWQLGTFKGDGIFIIIIAGKRFLLPNTLPIMPSGFGQPRVPCFHPTRRYTGSYRSIRWAIFRGTARWRYVTRLIWHYFCFCLTQWFLMCCLARCSTGKLVGVLWQADKLTAATSAVVVIFNVGIFNKDGLRDDFMICRLSLFNSGAKVLVC